MVFRAPTSLLAAALLAGCGADKSGPIGVSAIGGPPRLTNPSRAPLDPASAYLAENSAQGLVRFDAGGEIQPALAQSWVISDDGLRYTFRIARGARWESGAPVTAEQVVVRLRAAAAPASRNPLKPLLGAIEEIVKMTDDVIEIALKAPRPDFLQLLAQPEFAMVRSGTGSGPFRPTAQPDGSILLALPPPDEEEEDGQKRPPPVVLRGEPGANAVARFDLGEAELVIGGGIADLPFVRAAEPPATSLVFDPVDGLFGLAFTSAEGPLAAPQARQALAMAVDRSAIMQAFGIRPVVARETMLPAAIEGLAPAAAQWTSLAFPARRQQAHAALAGRRFSLRVAMPDGPGYRLLFAFLRRDWAAIGVDARRVPAAAPAELRLVDEVAPAALASWYLRHFTCDRNALCLSAADRLMEEARLAPNAAARRDLLAQADRQLSDAGLFIALGSPVRWSLVSPRLGGFRPNAFGRHPADALIARRP
jgi:peptide/nickel transport system substrate-binding protein